MLRVLEELISTLDTDAEVRDIRQGVFHTGVWTRHCGLAATLPKDALKQSPHLVKEAGSLLEKSAGQLARLALSPGILEAAIGMAAVNSLLETDLTTCVEINAAEIILEKGQGKKVAVIGHFPFLNKVKAVAEELWIIEKNPREGDFAEHQAADLLPRADVVALTGTSLTNHTFEDLLGLCAAGAYKIMLGDTVPLSPMLFDYGLDALSGTRVVDAHLALACVSQGANFRQIKGTKRLTMFRTKA